MHAHGRWESPCSSPDSHGMKRLFDRRTSWTKKNPHLGRGGYPHLRPVSHRAYLTKPASGATRRRSCTSTRGPSLSAPGPGSPGGRAQDLPRQFDAQGFPKRRKANHHTRATPVLDQHAANPAERTLGDDDFLAFLKELHRLWRRRPRIHAGDKYANRFQLLILYWRWRSVVTNDGEYTRCPENLVRHPRAEPDKHVPGKQRETHPFRAVRPLSHLLQQREV